MSASLPISCGFDQSYGSGCLGPVGPWILVAPCLAHGNMGGSNFLSRISATTETLCKSLLPIYLLDLTWAVCPAWNKKKLAAELIRSVCELCRLTVSTILGPVRPWSLVAPCLAHGNMGDSNFLSQMLATTETLCIYLLPIYLIDLPRAICLGMKKSTLAERFDQISQTLCVNFVS